MALRQWISPQENPPPESMSKRPFFQAEVAVSEFENNPGWYKVDLKATPHIKYDGAYFTLTLTTPTRKEESF
jgi:type VI secretion system protein ImpC